MASFSYGSRNTYSFDGNRPPYKIGRTFSAPTVSSIYYAPDKTGALAQPILITSMGIQVQGYQTATPSVDFGIWESNGSNGALTGSFNLTASNSSTTAGWTDHSISKLAYGGNSYIIGFRKQNTEIVLWNQDTTKSGSIIQDRTNTGSTFSIYGTAYESGTLVYRGSYSTLPIAPTWAGVNPITTSTNTITITWVAPSDNGGQAVSGYRIQRSTDGASWTTIVANTGTTSVTYTDSGLAYGQTYYYRVAAHNLVSTTAGTTYSGAYTTTTKSIATVNPGGATDKTSYLTVDVHNTDVDLISFDDTGSGIPFNRVEVAFAGDNFYNEVTATGNTATTDPQTVSATQDQAVYGVRSLSVDGLLNVDNEGVLQVAQELLWRYYKPDLRVQSIGILLDGLTPEQRSTVLGLELGTGVQVTFTPNGIGDPITRKCWVIGISFDVTLEYQQVVLKMQSAESEIFTLDSNVFGYLDTNILG